MYIISGLVPHVLTKVTELLVAYLNAPLQCHGECSKPIKSRGLHRHLSFSNACRENGSPRSVHPTTNWLCISCSPPLPRPHHAVLQVHAGRRACHFFTMTHPLPIFKPEEKSWKNNSSFLTTFPIVITVSAFLFPIS